MRITEVKFGEEETTAKVRRTPKVRGNPEPLTADDVTKFIQLVAEKVRKEGK